jgi:cytochrome c oxidase subunit 2
MRSGRYFLSGIQTLFGGIYMKKWTLLALACVLTMALTACGGKNNAASPSPSASAPSASAPASSTAPAASGGAAASEIILTASNWQFDKPEYRVKKGQAVKLTLDNKQGNHGAKIKELNVDLNGTNKSQTVTPDTAGTYEIRCSIPCGSGHTTMVSKLVVE